MLNGRDGPAGFRQVFHVVTGSDNSRLDGFFVTGGLANGFNPDGDGGGMMNNGASPAISNCAFYGNRARNNAGGMYIWSNASTTLLNCIFSENTATGNGGGIHLRDNSSATAINCVFYANSATQGGAIYNYSAVDLTIRNSILWSNLPDEIHNIGTYADVAYSNIDGGYVGQGNIEADPLFLAPFSWDFRLDANSRIDSADGNVAPTNDIEGNLRVDDPCTDNTQGRLAKQGTGAHHGL
jgi:parallel beta-helix repeat protein